MAKGSWVVPLVVGGIVGAALVKLALSGPSLSASPNPVSPGVAVTISATGFPPSSPLTIYSPDTSTGGQSFGTTDGNGVLSVQLPIPSNVVTGPYPLLITNANGSVSASIVLTIQ